jgi:hypothetical protein
MTETLLGRARWGREQADFGEMKKAAHNRYSFIKTFPICKSFSNLKICLNPN